MAAHNRIKTALALAATLGVLPATAAFARPALDRPAGGYGSSPLPTVEVVRTTHNSGFDWGDAGIGAAGGVGLSVLALGCGFAITGRRDRRPRRSVAAAS